MRRDTYVEVEGRILRLSNLEKVFYPLDRFKKIQVIDYYKKISKAVLPHLRGRLLTLKRFPFGVAGEHFYEKRCPSHRPTWVPTAHYQGIDYCRVEDLATLIWIANLASIELHTSLSMAPDLDRPTMVVFDLDPGAPADLGDCAVVALEVRTLLERGGLKSFPKTSGSKGMQVYVPLNLPRNVSITFADTKAYARAIAEYLEHLNPGRVVSRMATKLRPGKVLIDWSQNDANKTTVCAYSLRAVQHPWVSAPLSWAEVERLARDRKIADLFFGTAQVLRRFEERGDLFAPVLDTVQRLPKPPVMRLKAA